MEPRFGMLTTIKNVSIDHRTGDTLHCSATIKGVIGEDKKLYSINVPFQITMDDLKGRAMWVEAVFVDAEKGIT